MDVAALGLHLSGSLDSVKVKELVVAAKTPCGTVMAGGIGCDPQGWREDWALISLEDVFRGKNGLFWDLEGFGDISKGVQDIAADDPKVIAAARGHECDQHQQLQCTDGAAGTHGASPHGDRTATASPWHWCACGSGTTPSVMSTGTAPCASSSDAKILPDVSDDHRRHAEDHPPHLRKHAAR
ncbi:hypothetical protein FN846DRAFT_992253 [Sphaerosporella brunnea]|uniref:Uncharacterized protein n=1 Tax=Sphaerosporella brunnea TaxID=1250544 RepID=A0A5J5EPV3_9PEZI|nr:hypothetical protein FN846DRAFT_992253 [Sphaerosporella brunnea]